MTVPCVHSAMATSEAVSAGWVLHRRPYRNTSLLVDLLTDTHGRICAVAKGGRRDPLLQPFRSVQVRWRGAGDLKTLLGVEPLAPALPLTGDALYCGLYINEVLMRLLHRDDPHAGLLSLYQDSLAGLAEAGAWRDVLLRNFEFRLLDMLGYGIDLAQDANGHELVPGLRYRLVPEQGLVADIGGHFEGDLLCALARGDWQPEVRRLARNLMREALAPHLGDRPLASRELFRGAASASHPLWREEQ